MTPTCISKLTIIGLDNGLSPGRHQSIIWTNAGVLLIGPWETNFSEILKQILYIFIQENAYENFVRKLAAILSWPQCVNWLAPGRCDTNYCQTSNISRTLLEYRIVDHSDVVGAPPVGAAPTTSSFSTNPLVSLDREKTTARRCKNQLSFLIWCTYIRYLTVVQYLNTCYGSSSWVFLVNLLSGQWQRAPVMRCQLWFM